MKYGKLQIGALRNHYQSSGKKTSIKRTANKFSIN